jgi:hypothetical protein
VITHKARTAGKPHFAHTELPDLELVDLRLDARVSVLIQVLVGTYNGGAMCNVLRGDGIYVHVQVEGRRDFLNLERRRARIPL